MKLLVKVYEHQFVRNVITQEIIDSQVTIEEELNTFTVVKLQLPLIKIEEDNYIEIYEINNTDILIFSGNVYKVIPIWKQFGVINIECRGEKAIMQKRLAIKTKSNFNVKSVATLPQRPDTVSPIFNYWVNSNLTGVYNYLGTTIPESPESGPTPDPYYNWSLIPFTDTAFVLDKDTNLVKRIENGLILDEGTGTGIDINWILDDLLDDYSSVYNETWEYQTDFNQDISLDIKKGDNYFDIFDEIATQTGSTRDIKNSKIIFTKFGNDKTQGIHYQEIKYDGLFPNTSNVSSIDVIGTATRCNIVLGQGKNGGIIINDSGYVDRIYGVGKKEFRDGNLYEKTEKYLYDINKFQRIYKAQVESNSIDANIGDKIKLVVENTNSYFDISSDVIVLAKYTNYDNGSKITNYQVGDLNTYVSTGQNWLYGIKKDIKLLKVS